MIVIKVLLLSVTAGNGHHATGKAIADYLERRGVETAMLDTFEYINPVLSETIAKGYLISTQFSPKVYGKLYRLAEKDEKNTSKYSLARLATSLLSTKLISYIDSFDPDVIICTHIFAAQLITSLNERQKIRGATIGIVTDFTVHPFWEESNLDYYVTASTLLNYQMGKKGIPASKILPFGIPVDEKFSKKMPKEEARALLGIENKLTIFVMSGSMGYGKVEKIIKQMDLLSLDFQIISVCGNNKSLKKKIDGINLSKKIYNHGYVNNVDVMMDACDFIITKPGGLTMSESMAKGIPAILMNPIPGQEDRNVDFLLNNGICRLISKTYPIDVALYQLCSSSWQLESIEKALKNVGKPYATRDLCEFIISLQK